MLTEEAPVANADNQSVGTKEARVSTTGSFRDPALGTASVKSKEEHSVSKSRAIASP